MLDLRQWHPQDEGNEHRLMLIWLNKVQTPSQLMSWSCCLLPPSRPTFSTCIGLNQIWAPWPKLASSKPPHSNNSAPICLIGKLVTNSPMAGIKLGRGKTPHLLRKTIYFQPFPTHLDIHAYLHLTPGQEPIWSPGSWTDEGSEIIFLPVALSPPSPRPLNVPLGQVGLKE